MYRIWRLDLQSLEIIDLRSQRDYSEELIKWIARKFSIKLKSNSVAN